MTDNQPDHVSDNEERLEKLLRADLPPGRDAVFRIAVLARLERRRFRRQIAATTAVGVAMVSVGVNAAAISAWLAEDVTRIAGVLAVAAAAVWTFPGAAQVVPSAVRGLVRIWFARVAQIVSRSVVGS